MVMVMNERAFFSTCIIGLNKIIIAQREREKPVQSMSMGTWITGNYRSKRLSDNNEAQCPDIGKRLVYLK